MAGERGEEVGVKMGVEEREEGVSEMEEGGSEMEEVREEDGGTKGVERKEGEREGFTNS